MSYINLCYSFPHYVLFFVSLNCWYTEKEKKIVIILMFFVSWNGSKWKVAPLLINQKLVIQILQNETFLYNNVRRTSIPLLLDVPNCTENLNKSQFDVCLPFSFPPLARPKKGWKNVTFERRN
jgi:hypothetical protein